MDYHQQLFIEAYINFSHSSMKMASSEEEIGDLFSRS